MRYKCECNWEYNVEDGDENWEECPNCDLPYKHIRKNETEWPEIEIDMGDLIEYTDMKVTLIGGSKFKLRLALDVGDLIMIFLG